MRTEAAALAVGLVLLTGGAAHAGPSDPWVRAWGANGVGQLGNGSTLAQPTPAAVRGLPRGAVRQVAGGGWNGPSSFAVALLTDGTVRAWGAGTDGRLGDGTTVNRPYPVTVTGLAGVTEVAASAGAGYAVRGGRVLAWGDNTYGQAGDGVSGGSRTRPVAVQSLDRVKSLAAGCDHVAALREDGSLWSWGRNHVGQLGIGTTTDRATPQRVPDLTDVVSVTAGCHHTLALTADGTVKAWGRNWDGQLGNDSTTDSPVPVDVRHLTDVAAVYTGGYHSLAVLDDGSVRAWGWNGSGQLGDGTTVSRTTPVPAAAPAEVLSLAAGRDHTLAVLADGSVAAWGDNTDGQLGDGTGRSSSAPVTALPPGSGTTGVTTSLSWNSSYAY
ncbi:RCC1 domain-containing protein [Streptomyces sp. 4F14]|uniref:RCC1 domain-containing protein n=1 Tax=Streptomyces sp. 4F14 TaxID=3394380 RepID=UPI003A8B4E04